MNRTLVRMSVVVTTGLVAAGGLSACSSDSNSTGGGGTVSITVATGWGDTPAVANAFKGVVANFEKANPKIKVKLQTQGSNAYNQSINLRAGSSSPPDVFMLSTAGYGPGFYNLAKGGKLLALDSYASKNEWVSRFGDSALAPFKVDRKSGQLGSGSLYGLPQQNTMLGLYYNKSILTSLGVSTAPTSMADFEDTLAKAKAKGVIPLAATKDAFVHDQMMLWNAYETSADPITKWVYGQDGGTFASDANTKALDTLTRWQKQKYLQPGSQGVDYGTAVSTFTGGKALYFVAGPWLTGTVHDALGAKAGFMQMPSVSPTSPIGGGPSSPLVISSKTKHVAEDVRFLDFFNSEAQSNYLRAKGFGLPGTSLLPSTGGNPLDDEVAAILKKAESTGGVGVTPYINWASPEVNTDIYSGLEKVLGGQQSAADYLKQVQKDWVTAKSGRGKS
jgi:raffinose/stachyose/melibiose transport system substrate-binding protein